VCAATKEGTLYIAGGYTTAAVRVTVMSEIKLNRSKGHPAVPTWLNDAFEFCTATHTWRQLQGKNGPVSNALLSFWPPPLFLPHPPLCWGCFFFAHQRRMWRQLQGKNGQVRNTLKLRSTCPVSSSPFFGCFGTIMHGLSEMYLDHPCGLHVSSVYKPHVSLAKLIDRNAGSNGIHARVLGFESLGAHVSTLMSLFHTSPRCG
jgi:hypothetical protein